MHGMFRSNGGCGYLKKPEILMKKNPDSKDDVFDPSASLPVKKALQASIILIVSAELFSNWLLKLF